MSSISRLVTPQASKAASGPPPIPRTQPPPPPPADDPMASAPSSNFKDHIVELLIHGLRERQCIARTPGDRTLLSSLGRTVKNNNVDLPALPDEVMKVRKVLGSADPSPRALARALESDPALCGLFLSVANSPFYSRGHKIGSVPEAVVRIGMDRSAALTLAVVGRTRLYAGAPDDGAHALKAAVVAEHIAGSIGLAGSEAFIAGLLHDIGKRVLRDAARGVEVSAKEKVSHHALNILLHDLHPGFSALAASHWDFSETVISAINHHHLAQEGGMEAVILIPPNAERLTMLVASADILANHMDGKDIAEAGQAVLDQLSIENPEKILAASRETLAAFAA